MTEKSYQKWCKTMKVFRKIFHCHQLPERSFFFRGRQFPLCARCTGLVVGFILIGPIVSVFTLGNMYLSLAFVLAMCLDGFLQLKGVRPSTNFRRISTGLTAGYGVFSILVHVVVKIVLLV